MAERQNDQIRLAERDDRELLEATECAEWSRKQAGPAQRIASLVGVATMIVVAVMGVFTTQQRVINASGALTTTSVTLNAAQGTVDRANTQVAVANTRLTSVSVTLTAAAVQVLEGRNIIESQRRAAQAIAVMQDNTLDPRLAVLLSIRGLKSAYSPQADAALVQGLALNAQVRVLRGHWAQVYSVAFSPDGKTVVTGSNDHTARLWAVATGAPVGVVGGTYIVGGMTYFTSGVRSVAFSPDGKTILTGNDDGTARLWDATSGTLLRTLQGDRDDVLSVAFSPDGRSVLTASRGDKTAQLWDATSGARLRTLQGHTGDVFSAAFSPDGKTVLTGSGDWTARLWDTASGALLRTLQGHTSGVSSAVFSRDGKTILTGSFDETARLWDAASGAPLRILQGHADVVTSVAFSPDGKTVLTGSLDKTARLWDAASGAPLRTLQGHADVVTSVAFSPDGKTVLTGSLQR
jgi:WD40 repeat protein